MEINSTSSITEPQTASSAATTQLNTDIDSFLTLLTAQISNQDPLEPMDSSTFVTQLAQLSQVEQAIATNTNLESIGQQLASFSELSDVQLIGREVLVPSESLDLSYGQATMEYQLFENANRVSINILDTNGSVLREIDGLPTDPGTKHTVTWDGLDNNGVQVEDGAYKFKVLSLDAESNQMAYTGYATTFVDELSFQNGQPTLLLRNKDEVSSSTVLAIK
jgi:flagellar basal-body rod modification protein FlgD